jgi:phage shock protein C
MTKKLTRSRDDKWIGGVCGGIATYTGIDANVIRLIVALATILGAGSLIVAYVVAWVLIPAPRPIAPADVRPPVPPATASEPAPPSE